jgi:hypothetical protein
VLSRVLIGPMPLYFIDILSVLIIFLGRRHMGEMFRRHRKVSVVMLLFMLSLLPTTLSEYFRMGFMEPTYLLGRAWLHIIAVWALAGFLKNPVYLKRFLVGATGGCLVTAAVATLNSLPFTGPWVRAHIFTIDLLFPQRGMDIDTELRMIYDKGLAMRGNSLLGKSNVTGGVLIMMLPFVVAMLSHMRINRLFRMFFNVASIMIIVGLLVTYSRLTYLAMAAMFLGYFLYDRKEFARRFVPVISILAVGILYVGIQSAFFKFDFIIDKFDLTNEKYQNTNMARLYAYTRPLQLVIHDPSYIFRGAGRAHTKLREKQSDANILVLEDGEMHSVFAASIFWRGFIAMFLLFYLCYLLVSQTYGLMKQAKKQRLENEWLITAAFLSLIGLASPWLLEHFFVSKPSGHMFLFMYFATLIACIDIVKYAASEKVAQEVPDKPRVGGVMRFPARSTFYQSGSRRL